MGTQLRLGWASRDITPNRPVALRGQFNLRIATRTMDPLTLTALAVQSGDEGVIFVSLDHCGVDPAVLDRSRVELGQRLEGFDPSHLIVNATHTHTAPFSDDRIGLQKDADYLVDIVARYPDYMSAAEYGELLTEALVAAAIEAWEKRSAGQMAWGYSYAVVGENRRIRYFDDRAVMYGSVKQDDFSHVEGHVDHSVNLLFAYDATGNLTGVVVNVACPSQASESGQDYISADYWHDVREEVRRRHGSEVFVLGQCSAAGDQSPHRLVGTAAEDRMLRLKYGKGLDRAGGNLALRQDLARRIADAVDDAAGAVRQELHETVELRCEQRVLELPHWDVTEQEHEALLAQMAELKQQLEASGDEDRLGASRTAWQSKLAWCRRAVDRYENPPASVPSEMNVVRLGDIVFVTAPFEYYLDFGDRIKGRSAALQTFVVQLAGGGTYLPTIRAASGLSYGAVPASCKVSPEGGQVIVDEAVRIIAEMFAE